MKEPTGDQILTIAVYIIAATFVIGWLILFTAMFLQWALPSKAYLIENLLQQYSKPMQWLQKHSLYAILILFAIRILTALLGWAPPIHFPTDPDEPPDGP